MNKIFFAALFLLVFSAPAYSISEAEFQRLRNSSPALRKEDKLLNQTWKEMFHNVPKRYAKTLLNDQRRWIRTGRDESVEDNLMDGNGLACAYAIAALRWVKTLEAIS